MAGLGFQPVPLGRGVNGRELPEGRDAESALGRGVKEPSPSSRLKGRLAGPEEERPAGLLPGDLKEGLLLGRAPPARGLPLLVVNGRASPPSLRKGLGAPGRAEVGRDEEAGLSKLGLSWPAGRLGLGLSE